MLELLRTSLSRRLRYLAVGIAALAVAGGMATHVSLTDSSTHPSEPKPTHATPAAPEKSGKPAAVESGSRPTTTHGYCVSRAVAAAKVAKKAGPGIAAAARSCPAPGHAPGHATGAGRADGKSKPGTRGKSSTAPGHSRTR